jgi:hypothetical protein
MKRRARLDGVRAKSVHPYAGLWEPLEGMAEFEVKPMFGGRSVYVGGRLMLYFAAKDEPWRGVLVCTDRERHDALTKRFPALRPHPVLSKWLYLAEADEAFETLASRLVEAVRRGDPLIGVIPPARKPRRTQLRP